MKTLYRAQYVWEIFEKGSNESTNDIFAQNQRTTLNVLRKIDMNAPYLFYQVSGDDGFEKIPNATPAKEVWKKL